MKPNVQQSQRLSTTKLAAPSKRNLRNDPLCKLALQAMTALFPQEKLAASWDSPIQPEPGTGQHLRPHTQEHEALT